MSDNHEIALVAIWLPGHDLTDFNIRAQCECGWFANFATPVTLSRVNEIVNNRDIHRTQHRITRPCETAPNGTGSPCNCSFACVNYWIRARTV